MIKLRVNNFCRVFAVGNPFCSATNLHLLAPIVFLLVEISGKKVGRYSKVIYEIYQLNKGLKVNS